MFTKEEIDFTIKQIIEHTIFDIEDCQEYGWAVCKLKQLQGVLSGDVNEFKSYWYDSLCPVWYGLESYLSFFSDGELPLVKSIIDKLDLS